MGDKNRGLFDFNVLCGLLGLAFMAVVFFSCGNNNGVVSPTNTNTNLLIVNTSLDVGPITAFVNNLQLSSTTTYFRYSSSPTYYPVNSGDVSLQIRTDHNAVLINTPQTIIANKNYTLFLVGLKSIDSLATIFTPDTSSIPAIGRGKIRFINASPRTPALDLYANGTSAFAKIAYKKVSPYIELPAGIYDFKVSTGGGATTNILTDYPTVTIQDGKLYTLYTKGLVGHTDTAALSLNIITNK